MYVFSVIGCHAPRGVVEEQQVSGVDLIPHITGGWISGPRARDTVLTALEAELKL